MKVEKGTTSKAHIIVGSAGKILELFQKRYFDLSRVRIFVLDEADAMVATSAQARSMRSQTMAIKDAIPGTAQILFFSATFTPEILEFSKTIVPTSYTITLKNTESLVLKEIRQIAITTSGVAGGKLKVLQDIYTAMSINQSIVFCDMKNEANQVICC
jgi:ATP-dependent RNA helicase DDX19/DBP5